MTVTPSTGNDALFHRANLIAQTLCKWAGFPAISRRLPVAVCLLLWGTAAAAQPSVPESDLSRAATAVADRILREGQPSASRSAYHQELALEGLLEWSVVTGEPRYREFVLQMLADRGIKSASKISWRQQPFSCLTFEISRLTGDPAWLPVFVEQSRLLRVEVRRSPEGGILHPRGVKRGGGEALLIDALGEYVARMAQTGALTGEHEFYHECAHQLKLYSQIVRDPQTGLWSQGRGWLSEDPMALSPGFWSRGQGWLIRGIERSLRSLPPDSSEFQDVSGHFSALADSLIRCQSELGLWHCLLQRAPLESPLETSGSAMIASHLARGWQAGVLTDIKYRDAALRAFKALPQMVTADGVVLSVSPGPGPLETEAPWLRDAYPPDDPHGAFTILSAASAERLLINEAK